MDSYSLVACSIITLITAFILNHVIDAEIRTNAGFYIPVEKDKLYPVVTNLYIANMLPSVGKKTFNQLDIHTYDASGHEITDFSRYDFIAMRMELN